MLRCCTIPMLLAGLLPCRPAAADPQGYYGHILTITRQGQLAGFVIYRQNHSYTMVTHDSMIIQGAWDATAGRLCLKPTRSEEARFGLCVPDDPLHTLGDSWWVAPGGKPEQLNLVAGP